MNEWNPPQGLTPSAQKAREDYLMAISRQREKLREIALNILVWGPGKEGVQRIVSKRREIHGELLKLGHNAMMSEDMPELEDDDLYSEHAREFFQAETADLIIVLIEDAPGAVAEVHDFAGHERLASKFVVLSPVEYREGYGAKGLLKDLEQTTGTVHWYEEGDIEACNVLQAALIKAEARRFMRYKATF